MFIFYQKYTKLVYLINHINCLLNNKATKYEYIYYIKIKNVYKILTRTIILTFKMTNKHNYFDKTTIHMFEMTKNNIKQYVVPSIIKCFAHTTGFNFKNHHYVMQV